MAKSNKKSNCTIINNQTEFEQAFAGTFLGKIDLDIIKMWADDTFVSGLCNIDKIYCTESNKGLRQLVLTRKLITNNTSLDDVILNDFYVNDNRKVAALRKFVSARTKKQTIDGLTYQQTLEMYPEEIENYFSFKNQAEQD